MAAGAVGGHIDGPPAEVATVRFVDLRHRAQIDLAPVDGFDKQRLERLLERIDSA